MPRKGDKKRNYKAGEDKGGKKKNPGFWSVVNS